jgi:hypothetical protein
VAGDFPQENGTVRTGQTNVERNLFRLPEKDKETEFIPFCEADNPG